MVFLSLEAVKNEHNSRLSASLKRIQETGVTLNTNKCEFGKTQLKFLGHTGEQDGIRADPDKTSTVADTSPPTNISELRRFMGLVNQLGKFSPNLDQEVYVAMGTGTAI